MQTCNLTTDELSLVRLALITFRVHHEQEAKAMAEFAKDETFEEATRAQCERNIAASAEFVRRAAELLDAPGSPLLRF